MDKVNILWFRNGLRLHDNPSLQRAVDNGGSLLPIFIFDGESAGAFFFLSQMYSIEIFLMKLD